MIKQFAHNLFKEKKIFIISLQSVNQIIDFRSADILIIITPQYLLQFLIHVGIVILDVEGYYSLAGKFIGVFFFEAAKVLFLEAKDEVSPTDHAGCHFYPGVVLCSG